MFGFNSNKETPTNKNMAGALSLSKGNSLKITKTPLIKVTVSWVDPQKDYDLMALVLYKDGRVNVISYKQLSTADGAVKHLGDVGATSGDKTETIEIRMNDSIDRVAPFAYSAIENGQGSFREYGVSVVISNDTDQPVGIQANDSSPDRNRYTLCFGEIINGDQVTIQSLELYSRNHSEHQPDYVNGKLTMDAGNENTTK